jgi:hypothetical protein
MKLDGNGTLTPCTDKPFTHIPKPAGTSGYKPLPIVEWLARTWRMCPHYRFVPLRRSASSVSTFGAAPTTRKGWPLKALVR